MGLYRQGGPGHRASHRGAPDNPWKSFPLLAMTSSCPADTRLLLCGDVMTGHGIDPFLLPPAMHAPLARTVKSALEYVREAEAAIDPRTPPTITHGSAAGSAPAHPPLPRPLSFDYPWGDALPLLKREPPDLRLINLETTITERGAPAMPAPQARMHPLHLPTLAALGVDGAVLANRHVLDWGHEGLHDTLTSLRQAGIPGIGAGHDCAEADQEGQWLLPGKARVRLFAYGHPSSGLPPHWAAAANRPGINWLERLDSDAIRRLAARIRGSKEEGDLVIVSLHWGSNWGYEVPGEQRRFARALIDEAGVDLVWGHSSHHPRPIEVYRDRLILYGVGDFLKDASRALGHEAYRPHLAALYLPRLAADGRLSELRLWPLHVHLFRLKRAGALDCHWLARALSQECRCHGTGLELQADGSLQLRWGK